MKQKPARPDKTSSAKENDELEFFEKLVAQAGKLAASKSRETWKAFGKNLHAAIRQT